jgi:hypothetical protein
MGLIDDLDRRITEIGCELQSGADHRYVPR